MTSLLKYIIVSSVILCFLFFVDAQSVELKLIKYCFTRNQGQAYLMNIKDITELPSNDDLMFSNVENLQSDFSNELPCIIAYANPVPNSELICQAIASAGAYYFKCNDVVAIKDISTYNTEPFKKLGYFLQSIPTGQASKFTSVYTAKLEGIQMIGYNGLKRTFIHMKPSDHPSIFPSQTPGIFGFMFGGGWNAKLYGLRDFPTIINNGSTRISETLIEPYQKTYNINNKNSTSSFKFTLSDLLSTTKQTTFQIDISSSTTNTKTTGFSFTASAGVEMKFVSASVSKTTSTEFSTSQTSSKGESYANSVTYVEELTLSGEIDIEPGCELTITQNFIKSLEKYELKVLINNIPDIIKWEKVENKANGFISRTSC